MMDHHTNISTSFTAAANTSSSVSKHRGGVSSRREYDITCDERSSLLTNYHIIRHSHVQAVETEPQLVAREGRNFALFVLQRVVTHMDRFKDDFLQMAEAKSGEIVKEKFIYLLTSYVRNEDIDIRQFRQSSMKSIRDLSSRIHLEGWETQRGDGGTGISASLQQERQERMAALTNLSATVLSDTVSSITMSSPASAEKRLTATHFSMTNRGGLQPQQLQFGSEANNNNNNNDNNSPSQQRQGSDKNALLVDDDFEALVQNTPLFRQHLERLFEAMDIEDTGKVSWTEFSDFMTDCAVKGPVRPQQAAINLYKALPPFNRHNRVLQSVKAVKGSIFSQVVGDSKREVSSIAVLSNDSFVQHGLPDTVIDIYEHQQWRNGDPTVVADPVHRFWLPDCNVASFEFLSEVSPKILLVSCADLTMRGYDLRYDRHAPIIEIAANDSYSVMEWCKRWNCLYAAGSTGTVSCWKLNESGRSGSNSILPSALQQQQQRYSSSNGGNNGGPFTRVFSEQLHRSAVTRLAFLPTDGSIISASMEPQLLVQEPHRHDVVASFQGHRSGIIDLSYNADYHMLASSGFDPEIHLWSINTFTSSHAGHSKPLLLVDREEPHRPAITGIHFVPNTPQIMSLDQAGLLKVWDIRMYRCVQNVYLDGSIALKQESINREKRYTGMARLNNTKDVFCFTRRSSKGVMYTDRTREYDPRTADEVFSGMGMSHSLGALVTTTQSRIQTWELRSGVQSAQFDSSEALGDVTSMTCDYAGRKVIVGYRGGYVAFYSVSNGHMFRKIHVTAFDVDEGEAVDIVEIAAYELHGVCFAIDSFGNVYAFSDRDDSLELMTLQSKSAGKFLRINNSKRLLAVFHNRFDVSIYLLREQKGQVPVFQGKFCVSTQTQYKFLATMHRRLQRQLLRGDDVDGSFASGTGANEQQRRDSNASDSDAESPSTSQKKKGDDDDDVGSLSGEIVCCCFLGSNTAVSAPELATVLAMADTTGVLTIADAAGGKVLGRWVRNVMAQPREFSSMAFYEELKVLYLGDTGGSIIAFDLSPVLDRYVAQLRAAVAKREKKEREEAEAAAAIALAEQQEQQQQLDLLQQEHRAQLREQRKHQREEKENPQQQGSSGATQHEEEKVAEEPTQQQQQQQQQQPPKKRKKKKSIVPKEDEQQKEEATKPETPPPQQTPQQTPALTPSTTPLPASSQQSATHRKAGATLLNLTAPTILGYTPIVAPQEHLRYLGRLRLDRSIRVNAITIVPDQVIMLLHTADRFVQAFPLSMNPRRRIGHLGLDHCKYTFPRDDAEVLALKRDVEEVVATAEAMQSGGSGVVNIQRMSVSANSGSFRGSLSTTATTNPMEMFSTSRHLHVESHHHHHAGLGVGIGALVQQRSPSTRRVYTKLAQNENSAAMLSSTSEAPTTAAPPPVTGPPLHMARIGSSYTLVPHTHAPDQLKPEATAVLDESDQHHQHFRQGHQQQQEGDDIFLTETKESKHNAARERVAFFKDEPTEEEQQQQHKKETEATDASTAESDGSPPGRRRKRRKKKGATVSVVGEEAEAEKIVIEEQEQQQQPVEKVEEATEAPFQPQGTTTHDKSSSPSSFSPLRGALQRLDTTASIISTTTEVTGGDEENESEDKETRQRPFGRFPPSPSLREQQQLDQDQDQQEVDSSMHSSSSWIMESRQESNVPRRSLSPTGVGAGAHRCPTPMAGAKHIPVAMPLAQPPSPSPLGRSEPYQPAPEDQSAIERRRVYGQKVTQGRQRNERQRREHRRKVDERRWHELGDRCQRTEIPTGLSPFRMPEVTDAMVEHAMHAKEARNRAHENNSNNDKSGGGGDDRCLSLREFFDMGRCLDKTTPPTAAQMQQRKPLPQMKRDSEELTREVLAPPTQLERSVARLQKRGDEIKKRSQSVPVLRPPATPSSGDSTTPTQQQQHIQTVGGVQVAAPTPVPLSDMFLLSAERGHGQQREQDDGEERRRSLATTEGSLFANSLHPGFLPAMKTRIKPKTTATATATATPTMMQPKRSTTSHAVRNSNSTRRQLPHPGIFFDVDEKKKKR